MKRKLTLNNLMIAIGFVNTPEPIDSRYLKGKRYLLWKEKLDNDKSNKYPMFTHFYCWRNEHGSLFGQQYSSAAQADMFFGQD